MALAPVAAAGADQSDQSMTGSDANQGAADQSQVLVTICKTADGTYTVYAGDEPDEPGEGTPAEEGAEGSEPAEGEPQGQPAESIGAALKAALDILKSDESENGGGQKALEDGFSSQGDLAAPANPPGA